MRRSRMACAVAAGLAAPVLALTAIAPASAHVEGTKGWQLALTVHAPAGYPATDDVTMTSVSAPRADDVWAVGAVQPRSGGSAPDHPVLEHWNGHVWTQVAMPREFATSGDLQVAASSSTDVWVFNSSFKSQGRFAEKPLWAHWNGRSWTVGSLPAPVLTASGDVDILTVAAAGPDDIWAGGVATSDYPPNTSTDNAFLANYNGRAWKVYPFPYLAGAITGISALSPTDIWAVGTGDTGASNEVNLLLHWNGRSWQSIRIPGSLSGAGSGAGFRDVVAESSHSAWVAGLMPWLGHPPGYFIPGVAYWDGTRWTTSTIPTTVAKAAQLTSEVPVVSAASDGSGGIWLLSQFTNGIDGQNPPGQVWHYAHGRWSTVPEPGITGWDTATTLTTVPGGGEAWAAGYTLKTRPGSGLVFRFTSS